MHLLSWDGEEEKKTCNGIPIEGLPGFWMHDNSGFVCSSLETKPSIDVSYTLVNPDSGERRLKNMKKTTVMMMMMMRVSLRLTCLNISEKYTNTYLRIQNRMLFALMRQNNRPFGPLKIGSNTSSAIIIAELINAQHSQRSLRGPVANHSQPLRETRRPWHLVTRSRDGFLATVHFKESSKERCAVNELGLLWV